MSEGLDLEVSGEVAPGWEVFAGYTYNRNENEMDDVIYSALTPRHTFKLWTDYILPGAYAKWGVGGGVTAKSTHGNTCTYWVMTDAGWTQPTFTRSRHYLFRGLILEKTFLCKGCDQY